MNIAIREPWNLLNRFNRDMDGFLDCFAERVVIGTPMARR